MDKKKVRATVGTRRITEEDVDKFIKSMDEKSAEELSNEDGRKKVVNELINRELFYLDAVNNGLEEDEGYLEELEKVKVSLLKQYAINTYVDDVTVSDEEVADFYKENKETFVVPEGVRVSHILFNSEINARKALKEIKGGLLFSEAAKKYSECPSKSKGGDLGFLTKDDTVPEFGNAVFQLEQGDVSGPLKTRYGYHLLKVTEKKPKTLRSLDEVSDLIRNHLLTARRREKYRKRANELRKEYTVKIK